MALVHRAELRPTKLELLSAWLPTLSWYPAPVTELARVVSFRFDDPAGEVGVETIIVRDGDGPLFQVPLTYRAAPLDGADAFFIGTTEHSVLGRRWVYDACGDPVYAATLANAIVTGGREAEEFVDVDGRPERREPAMSAIGGGAAGAAVPGIGALVGVDDGDPTLIRVDPVELSVARALTAADGPQPLTLTATWDGQSTPLLLARVRVR